MAGAPLLVAHRGGAALAPENTLLAFRRAVEWWDADMLELDVHATLDGEIVVFHDSTLERTTDGSGSIADHTLEQVRKLDAGYRFTPDGGQTFPFRGRGVTVPTLREVLEALPGVRVNVEIKDPRAQDGLWEVIRAAGATGRLLIAAGSSRNRARLRVYPLPTSAGKEELWPFYLQVKLGLTLYAPEVDALQIPDTWQGRRIASRDFVEAAHRLNLPVHVWTIDEIPDMNRLLDWGVDGIMSDRPDRLARVLNERFGRPIPPGPPDPLPEPFLERLLRL
jgi:glycerophosphoryl diester phosphodiesterase